MGFSMIVELSQFLEVVIRWNGSHVQEVVHVLQHYDLLVTEPLVEDLNGLFIIHGRESKPGATASKAAQSRRDRK
jgi:hypothetical protein